LVPPELDAQIVACDEAARKKPPKGVFDVVGISAMTSQATRAYELADHYRALGMFVVLGGYHVTLMPDEALTHADAIVTGEGIKAWPQLLRDFASGEVGRRVYADDRVYAAGRPTPLRRITKTRAYAPLTSFLASNGCTNNCAFCSSRALTPHYTRPVADIIEELRGLKGRLVAFFDPNFFADREHSLELLKAMEPLKLRWGTCATVEFAFDDELMDAAVRAGCLNVLIGFETLKQQSIDAVGKKTNNVEFYKQAIDNIHSRNMNVIGTFVLGFDTDTVEDLESLPDRIEDLGIDILTYYILAPAPGTSMFEEFQSQGRILTTDWGRYTQAEVVFQPKNMTSETLFDLYKRAWKKTYSLKSIVHRIGKAKSSSVFHKILGIVVNIGFKFVGRDRS
jgi:radical SAM superfamily enzyme YgiQ (UPF0313 family)